MTYMQSPYTLAHSEPEVAAAHRTLDVEKGKYDDANEDFHVTCSTVAYTVIELHTAPSADLRERYARQQALREAAFTSYMDAYDQWAALRLAAEQRITENQAAAAQA